MRHRGYPAGYSPDLMAPPAPPPRAAPPIWREYFLYTADFTGAKQLVAGTADGAPNVQVFDSFEIRIDSDADFEFLKTIYTATDPRIYVRYRDETQGRLLQRGTIDLRLLGSQALTTGMPAETTGFLPFVWPQPHVIAAASVFTIDAADFSGAANTSRMTFHGNKVRPGLAPWTHHEDGRPRQFRAKVPYTYPLPADGTSFSIAANQTIPFSIPIDIEADFLVYKIMAQHTGTAQILIQDGPGRERFWMDRSVDVRNLAGNGLYPNILPSPRFVYRGSAITGFFQDTSGATNRVRLYITGVKLYEV